MAEPDVTAGQSTTADSTGTDTGQPGGTTDAGTQGSKRQSAKQSQATTTGSDTAKADSFFDPESIKGKPELEAAYKGMQRQFTKAMQGIRDNRQKIDTYDRYMANPTGALQELAKQYGYSLVQGTPQASNGEDWQPKTWGDVLSKAKEVAKAELMEEFSPLVGEVRKIRQQNVEQYLDNQHSDWRQYEDDMLGLLKEHPTLVGNPDLLYEMAVPSEVREARALRAAESKIKGSKDASQISGPGTGPKRDTEDSVKGIKSFNDAVERARRMVRAQGILPQSNA